MEWASRVEQDPQAREEQRQVERHHQQASHKTQFLADDREEKVGRILRQIPELLHAVAQTPTSQSTTRDGRHRLKDVIADALGVGIGIKEGAEPIEPVGTGEEGSDDGGTGHGEGQKNVGQATTACSQHHQADDDDHHGSAKILDADEPADDEDDGGSGKESPAEFPDAIGPSHEMPCQEQHKAPLGDLAGLESDRPDIDPPSGTVYLPTDSRDLHHHEQQERDREQPSRNPMKPGRLEPVHGGEQSTQEGYQGQRSQEGRSVEQESRQRRRLIATDGQASGVNGNGAKHEQARDDQQQCLPRPDHASNIGSASRPAGKGPQRRWLQSEAIVFDLRSGFHDGCGGTCHGRFLDLDGHRL